MDVTQLGAIIRAAREAAGISQGDLGRMAACSRVTVNNAECGRVAIGADVLMRLLRPLGLSVTDARPVSATSAIELLARQGSVSYRESVSSEDLAATFATGKVDERWLPHIATILDEASDPLLLRAVQAVAEQEGMSTARVWRKVKKLAADLGSPNPRWRHAA